MTLYLIGTSGQKLLFAPKVLTRFRRHQQRRFFEREADREREYNKKIKDPDEIYLEIKDSEERRKKKDCLHAS